MATPARSPTLGRERRLRGAQLELPGMGGDSSSARERGSRDMSFRRTQRTRIRSGSDVNPGRLDAAGVRGQRVPSGRFPRSSKPVPPRASAAQPSMPCGDRVASAEQKLELLVFERRRLRPAERSWVLRIAKTARDHRLRGLTQRQAAVITDIFDRFRQRLGA
jgi:hypothetical protein